MSDLIVTKDVWKGVNDTQKPFPSASKLVICPNTKSEFQIIKHNLDTYKAERKSQFVVTTLHHFAYLGKKNKQKSTKTIT